MLDGSTIHPSVSFLDGLTGGPEQPVLERPERPVGADGEGHCQVPRHWPDDPALATWVHVQRSRYQRGALQRDREERLTALGFELTPYHQSWETYYAALRSFRDTHGHCNVPIRSRANRALGR
jgi:hypothetical protein